MAADRGMRPRKIVRREKRGGLHRRRSWCVG